MTAKVIFSHGRRGFDKGGKFSKSADTSLSQRVAAKVKSQFVNEGGAEAVAAVYRRQVQVIAKGYYMAMLGGCGELVDNSHVPARVAIPGQPRNTVPVNLTVTAEINKQAMAEVKTLISDRKATQMVKSGQLVLNKKKEWEALLAPVRVQVHSGWPELSMRYFLESPRSERFYTKRTDPAKSARLAFIARVEEWVKKANTLKDKRGLQNLSADAEKGEVKFEFIIDYPKIDEEFDFIRKAYARARWYNLEYVGPNTGERGIIYAEMARPLLRPYAIAMGHRFRDLLSRLK